MFALLRPAPRVFLQFKHGSVAVTALCETGKHLKRELPTVQILLSLTADGVFWYFAKKMHAVKLPSNICQIRRTSPQVKSSAFLLFYITFYYTQLGIYLSTHIKI